MQNQIFNLLSKNRIKKMSTLVGLIGLTSLLIPSNVFAEEQASLLLEEIKEQEVREDTEGSNVTTEKNSESFKLYGELDTRILFQLNNHKDDSGEYFNLDPSNIFYKEELVRTPAGKLENVETYKRMFMRANGIFGFKAKLPSLELFSKNIPVHVNIALKGNTAPQSVKGILKNNPNESTKTTISNNPITLSNAYANVGMFTMGYTTSMFSDSKAEPHLVEEGANLISTVRKTFLVGFESPFFIDGLFTGLSIERSQLKGLSFYESDIMKAEELFPALTAKLKYQHGSLFYAQLSGLYNILEYKRETIDVENKNNFEQNVEKFKKGKSDYINTFGLQLSGKVNILPDQLMVFLQGIYGKGITPYIAGLSDLPRARIKKANQFQNNNKKNTKKIDVDLLSSWGISGGVEYHIIPQVFVTLFGSYTSLLENELNTWNKDGDLLNLGNNDQDLHKNSDEKKPLLKQSKGPKIDFVNLFSGVASLNFKLSERIKTGLEYSMLLKMSHKKGIRKSKKLLEALKKEYKNVHSKDADPEILRQLGSQYTKEFTSGVSNRIIVYATINI